MSSAMCAADNQSADDASELAANNTSVGWQLKNARLLQGLTRQQVADRLNMFESYIRFLEADAFDSLPGATFTRGYLRSYAASLGLPIDWMMNCYEQQISALPNARPGKRAAINTLSSGPLLRGLGVAVILLFFVSSMIWWQDQQDFSLGITDETATAGVVEVETVTGETVIETLDLSESVITRAGYADDSAEITGTQVETKDNVVEIYPANDGASEQLGVGFSDENRDQASDTNAERLIKGAGEPVSS